MRKNSRFVLGFRQLHPRSHPYQIRPHSLIQTFSDRFLREHWGWFRFLARLDGLTQDQACAPLEWRLSFIMRAGDILLADRAYDSDALRIEMTQRGAWTNIKPMPNRKNIPVFSTFLYRYRNLVERFFNRLKHFRAVATRYDKRDDNFLASVQLASIRIWLRHNESVT
jgi:transposase